MEKGKRRRRRKGKRKVSGGETAVGRLAEIVENRTVFNRVWKGVEGELKIVGKDQRGCRFLMMSLTISFSRGTRRMRASALRMA